MKPLGYVDEVNRYRVAGWAGDLDAPADPLALVIHLNGEICGRIAAADQRDGLDEVGLAPRGAYGFRYYFDPPLSPFHTHSISVSAEVSGDVLEPGVVVVHAVEAAPSVESFRAATPLLVSTMGRSGSTLLRALLSRHPQIVVAGRQPFEVEMLTYYSYLFRALVAPGDHERSLAMGMVTHVNQRFHIGLNPYFDGSFRANFEDPGHFDDFMKKSLPNTMRSALRDTISDFYAAVATDQRKRHAIYFAEKAVPEVEIGETVRYMFPHVREIMLVRDLRDVVLSFVQFFKIPFTEAVDFVNSSSFLILMAKQQPERDILFVRYEDLVERVEETADAIFRHLGLPNQGVGQSSLQTMFQGHGTAKSPSASIGRWRDELDADQQRECSVFDAFQIAFGYQEATSPPVSSSSAVADTQTDPALMLGFESLGENCEFGLVQRRCGAEPLGLLRFASAPYADLMTALRARFAGLGRADLLEIQISDNGTEYMVKDLMYGFLWHAWVQVGEMTPEEVLQREQRRVPLLVRKMLEDLASGEKVMVYHGMQPLRQSQAEALAALIAEIGPRTTLLWVELAEPGHAAGSVVRLGPHLVKGFVDRFAPGENAHDLSLDCWISVCRGSIIV